VFRESRGTNNDPRAVSFEGPINSSEICVVVLGADKLDHLYADKNIKLLSHEGGKLR
jgi:hypothetical protein